MKIVINLIAAIVLVIQCIAFVLGVLTLRKAEKTTEILLQYFHVVAYICSLLAVVIFFVEYNFNFKILKNNLIIFILLTIVLLAMYIHVSQLFVLRDFVLVSCCLLSFDFYIVYHILKIKKIVKWE